jgi:hypothetical protein
VKRKADSDYNKLRDAAEAFERMGREHDAEAERRRTGF